MAEKEQAHRMQIEQGVLDANLEAQRQEAKDVRRGTWIGAIISIVSICSAVYAAHISPTVAVALVGLPLASVVRAIVLRK
jgi:uncharacterized membrane protein